MNKQLYSFFVETLRVVVVQPPVQPTKDYVNGNVRTVVNSSPKSKQWVDPAAPLPKREDYGSVPSYLQERKESWAEAKETKRLADEAAAACPPGHRLLPDDERIETLAGLLIAQKETSEALQSMPLVVSIPSQIRKQQASRESYTRTYICIYRVYVSC